MTLIALTLVALCSLHVLAPATVRADAADDAYLVAAGLYKRERWDLAAESFQKFIADFPKNPRVPTARFFLGLSLVNNGDYKPARDQLRTFLLEAPMSRNAAHAVYRIAECSYLLEDLARAEPELATFVNKYPDDPLVERALPYLGDVQLRAKKVDQAFKSYQEALRRFPAGPLADDCQFGIARIYEARQQPEKAMAIYTRLAAKTGSDRAPEAQLTLGNRLYDGNQFEQAAAAFQKLTDTFPRSPLVGVAHLNHGFSLFEIKQFDKAAEQFTLAEKDPQQAVEAAFWRGQCLSAAGDHTAAAALLKDLYEKNRDHRLAERILFSHADAEQRLGHQDVARQAFLELVKRFPNGERADDALHLATTAAFELADTADVERLLAQFQQTFPQSPLRWEQDLLTGRLQLQKGQTAAALPLLSKILVDEAPVSTRNWARYYLAFAHLELGQPAEALTVTDPLVEIVEQLPQSLELSGVFLVRSAAQLALANREPVANAQRDLYSAAMASATEFLNRAPQAKEVDQALAVRALAAVHSGLKDRAREDVETLLQKFAASPELDKTLYEVAEVAYSNEDWEWSTELFGKLMARGPESRLFVSGLTGQAWSYFKRKDFDAAGKLFAQVVKDHPTHKDAAEASFMHGKSLQNSNQALAAAPVFDQTLDQFPTSRFAYLAGLEAARIRRDAMQYVEADRAFAAVLEKFPKPDHLDKVLNEWALSNFVGKQFARSDEVFARLIQETPDSDLADNARLNLAESDLVAGKLDVAQQKFQALESDPKSDEGVQQTALYQLIVIGAEQKNWELIRKATGALQQRFPQSKYHWFAELHGADADRNLMAVAQAIPRLKALIEQRTNPAVSEEPWFLEAWILLAESQLQEKLHEDVAQTVAECRAWRPDAPMLYVLDEILARSLKTQGKLNDAIAAFQRVTKDGAGTETAAKAQFMIGEIYLLQKNYKQAEKEYLTLVTLYPFPEWKAYGLYQAGCCQQELKLWKEAARSFTELLQDFPDFQHAADASKRLQDVKSMLKT